MKPKKDEYFLTVAFCAFLGIMMLLFVFGPKNTFSELEKRYLAESPTVTWENIASGKFSQEVDDYMADHLPGRDFFVGLNAYVNLLTGRQVSTDIYVTDDGRLVEAPTKWDEAAALKNMAAINRFAQTTGKNVTFMIAPSAGWAVQDTILGPADSYNDEAIIESIYAMADPALKIQDLISIYKAHEAPGSLYYRTDHHWTSLGAYLAYEAFCTAQGQPVRPQSDFTVETVDGFHGSTYSRAALWLTKAESLELWHGSDKLTVSNGETEGTHAGPFYRDRLEEADKYTVYLDGNHSVVRLHNPEGSGKLLVVRDSYSNCLGAFLAESYEEVILVDLRYYKQPISALLEQEGIEDVLICYSIGNFMTDANIIWLR